MQSLKHARNGETPLHFACEVCAPIEMIRFLLSRYPGVASVSGGPKIGLPIHVALQHGEYEHAVSVLLDAFPAAASIPRRELSVGCLFTLLA